MKQKHYFTSLLLMLQFVLLGQILDQSYTPSVVNPLYVSSEGVDAGNPGQTFTAGTTNVLSRIAVQISNKNGNFVAGSFQLKVYAGTNVTAAPLSTTNFTISMAPPASGALQELAIDLSTPLSITAGSAYTFTINATAPAVVDICGVNIDGYPGGGYNFAGNIDEVRVWNVAKTAEQISGSKNCELQGTETGLIAYYKFNQGFDASNNTGITTLTATTGPNGTLNSFTLNGATSNWLAGSPVTTGSIIPGVATVTTPVVYTQGATATALTATTGTNGTGLLWYTTATGGTGSTTAPTPSTASVGTTSYWVSSTNANGCESARVQIVVTVSPTNDNCNGAITLTVGPSSFNDFPLNVNLTGATNSGTPTPTCGNFQGGDLWYSVTVPASGNVIIETKGVGNYDSGLEVYTGSCGALNLVTCDDNTGTNNYSYVLLLGQTPGTVLKVRVWENFWANSNAQFQISAYEYINPATHLNFDGVNDHILLSAATINNLPQGSIGAWIRPTAAVLDNQTICAKQSDFENSYAIFSIGGDTAANGKLFYKSKNGASIVSTSSIVANQWTHVAVTFTGTQAQIYLNGVLDATASGDFSLPNDTSVTATSIGAWLGNGNGQYFTGDIDEFRVWNVTLSQTDIQNLMNCEAQSQPELVAYYKFNQGNDNAINSSITSLTDSSGNNYTGTLTSFALTGSTSNWKVSSPVTIGNVCTVLNTIGFDINSNFKVYPNPSTGIFTIALKEEASVEIYDLLGKVIYTNKVNAGESKIDISNYQSGIYLLNVKTENGSTTQKVMKE